MIVDKHLGVRKRIDRSDLGCVGAASTRSRDFCPLKPLPLPKSLPHPPLYFFNQRRPTRRFTMDNPDSPDSDYSIAAFKSLLDEAQNSAKPDPIEAWAARSRRLRKQFVKEDEEDKIRREEERYRKVEMEHSARVVFGTSAAAVQHRRKFSESKKDTNAWVGYAAEDVDFPHVQDIREDDNYLRRKKKIEDDRLDKEMEATWETLSNPESYVPGAERPVPRPFLERLKKKGSPQTVCEM
jgi:hypothetical protein